MKCDKCGCTGRRKQVVEKEGGAVAVLICPNPRCTNYKREIGEEPLKAETTKS